MQPRKRFVCVFSGWAGRNTSDRFNLHSILVQRCHCVIDTHLQNALKYRSQGFPGGSVVKNQPASAGESQSRSVMSDFCDPVDYAVGGILWAKTLEWVAFPFSWGSSQPRDQTQVPHIAGGFFTS